MESRSEKNLRFIFFASAFSIIKSLLQFIDFVASLDEEIINYHNENTPKFLAAFL